MPVFQVRFDVQRSLRLSEEFALNGFQFSPEPEGFSVILEIDASSIEIAEKEAAPKIQLLLDCITFAKGHSLQYHLSQITEMPQKEGGSLALTVQAFSSAEGKVVVKEGRAGIAPAFQLSKRIASHKKGEVLTRVLRWYARGTSDTDSVDKFVDYWIALETLADSYEGEVEAQVCPECGHTGNPRPVNGVLRAYLKSVGMIEAANRISTLAEARSKLFHEGSPKALKYLPDVQGILRDCLQTELTPAT